MDRKESILIVDDDESICRSLSLIFGKNGYETETARTGREALEKAKRRFFNAALLDIRLPEMKGIELVEPLKKMHPNMVLIMVTGYASLENVIRALNNGVSAYITKPLNMDEVLATVKETLEKQHLMTENRRLCREAQRELVVRKQMEAALQQSFEKLQRTMEDTIQCMARIVEMKDLYTAGHQRRVTQLALAIAKEMNLSKEQIDGIRMAGIIHDIGKISIPAEILSKPCQLNEIEFGMIKTHTKTGYEIVSEIEFPWPVAQILLQHHERMDGSGYPQGLSAKNILLEARILAVADVVEAMTSHRPYRPARGIDKALDEISQNKGILYDPDVVNACLKLFTEKGFKFE
ncbi:MAG: HD domain-containing phosphohydrolase [bacterium]